MNQSEKAERFAGLHVKGRPVLLYNAWDAGSAKVDPCGRRASNRHQQLVRRRGARLSRWGGDSDRACRADRGSDRRDHRRAGHRRLRRRLYPMTMRVGGQHRAPARPRRDRHQFRRSRRQGFRSLHITRQAERIATVRDTAEKSGVKLFINARTDVFFEHGGDAAGTVARGAGAG